MERLTNCEVCLDSYNDSARYPTTLLCGHTYCLECVTKLSERKQKIVRLEVNERQPEGERQQRQIVKLIDRLVVVRCPVCRDITGYKPHVDPRKNFLLLDIIEALNTRTAANTTQEPAPENTPSISGTTSVDVPISQSTEAHVDDPLQSTDDTENTTSNAPVDDDPAEPIAMDVEITSTV